MRTLQANVLILFLPSLLLAGLNASGQESPKADNGDWKQARLIRSVKPKESLKDISWTQPVMEVTSDVEGSSFQPKVKVQGRFQKDEWILVKGEQPLKLEPKTGEFSFDLPLLGEVTPIHLYAIGPLGEVEDEKAVVAFPGWEEYGRKLREVRIPRPAIFAGLGVSTLSYTQTGLPDFQEKGITFRMAYQGVWKAPWDYGFTTFFTVLPFGSNLAGANARFFGFNGRVGYGVPWLKEPWRLSLMAGFYYTTMIVSGASFGYKNLAGPMVYPVLRRIVSAKDTVSGYFKLSPVSNGFGFLAFDSRELAMGISWARQEPGSRPFSVGLDFAALDLNLVSTVGKVTTKTTASSHSISLGFSYGF